MVKPRFEFIEEQFGEGIGQGFRIGKSVLQTAIRDPLLEHSGGNESGTNSIKAGDSGFGLGSKEHLLDLRQTFADCPRDDFVSVDQHGLQTPADRRLFRAKKRTDIVRSNSGVRPVKAVLWQAHA